MPRAKRLVRNVDHYLGRDWEGWQFGHDGLLYCPAWRTGFNPHELRAMFWRCQQVTSLESTIKHLKNAVERASATIDDLEKQRDWYRRQVVLEARLGLALARIVEA